MAMLRRIAREKRSAVIAVTHDERMIEGFDTLYRMDDGRLAKAPRDSPR
jgi:putative ABC transport system ATP-binding protein